MADTDIDALIDAVCMLRITQPEATAKELHALLVDKPRWADTTLSDVKKAASKATKRAAQQKAANPAVPQTHICAGQHVKLNGLKQRLDVNGYHGIVVAADNEEEAASLLEKGRLKVQMLHTSETICVRPANAEAVSAAANVALYSTKHVLVAHIPQHGYGMRAQCNFSRGEQILREKPIATSWDVSVHQNDRLIQELMRQLQPYLGIEGGCPAADAIMDRVLQRVTELDYAELAERDQTRWMSLVDSFSTPPAKTAFNIWKSNAYAKEGDEEVMGGNLYELLSRANHSCAPNVSKHVWEGGNVVTAVAMRDITAGEELFICYLPEVMGEPTSRRRELLREKYNFTCECKRCGPIEVGVD